MIFSRKTQCLLGKPTILGNPLAAWVFQQPTPAATEESEKPGRQQGCPAQHSQDFRGSKTSKTGKWRRINGERSPGWKKKHFPILTHNLLIGEWFPSIDSQVLQRIALLNVSNRLEKFHSYFGTSLDWEFCWCFFLYWPIGLIIQAKCWRLWRLWCFVL